MRPVVARYGAPVAFLVAATVAILLVRSTLGDETSAAHAGPVTTAAAPSGTRTATTRRATTRKAAAPQENYEIRAGDTLGSVADRYDTTVETLVGLNPGIDPTGLQVGQRIRVK